FCVVAAGVAVLGDTLLVALIFYFVFPRRYQVFSTKLRIVLGWPLGWDIPLSTIKEDPCCPWYCPLDLQGCPTRYVIWNRSGDHPQQGLENHHIAIQPGSFSCQA
ncbi:MAG: hypothetical protein NTU41_12300, partial [Chloroflexi bacterium]|nr:hypothetical protein [Chloroflexota bacterium]